MIDALHPDGIEAVLNRHHVGRLACIVASVLYLVPIADAFRDRVLAGHSRPG